MSRVWKLIVPMSFVVFMSWAVFWLSPQNLAPCTGLSATSMLTLIAFRLALGSSLPPITKGQPLSVGLFLCRVPRGCGGFCGSLPRQNAMRGARARHFATVIGHYWVRGSHSGSQSFPIAGLRTCKTRVETVPLHCLIRLEMFNIYKCSRNVYINYK